MIGEQVGAVQVGRLIGPDLFGVTDRRDPEWLARWIAEPDKMLAEKDPLALQLFEQYKGVAMPNMSLNRKEVDSVVEFIETESRRVAASQTGVAARAEAMAAATGEPAACCQKGESALPTDCGLAPSCEGDIEGLMETPCLRPHIELPIRSRAVATSISTPKSREEMLQILLP